MRAKSFKLLLLGASATTAGLFSLPSLASAATAAAAEGASSVSEVVVTARNRRETVIDVPLAISVVTEAKLEQMDISNTTELANYTPGLEFNSFTPGDARNDRGPDRPIIMRGLNLGIGGSQGATLFLDGAAVSGNEVPASMDIGQVEVLRGPQSVYFGRSTLTGAVSYRTKAIGNELSGEVELKVAQQGERDVEATVSGAVIPDVLKLRLTGLTQTTDGYATNAFNNGADKLGAQTRNSISTTVIFTPVSQLEFKGYVNYFRDDDGAAVTAFVPQSFDNCKLPGASKPTICGKVPGSSNSVNYKNTVIPAAGAAIIFSTPVIRGADFDPKIGTQREVINTHLVSTWNINDLLKVTEISAYHKSIDVSADDGFGQAPPPGSIYNIYMYTYSVRREDRSHEIRLTSDPDKRLSFTVGANYIKTVTTISAFLYKNPQITAFDVFKQAIIPGTSETVGVFGGAYFKVTDRLTLSGEVRRQSDKISNTIPLSATFKSTSPRVSLDYAFGGNKKIYASYAEGTLPGGFNSSVSPYKSNPVVIGQIQTLLGVSTDNFKEEVLKMSEVGIKGTFNEGRGFFDLNIYKGELTNQQLRASQLIPALGFSVSVTNNAGKSDVHGVEFQGSYNFTDELSLSTTAAWNYAKRTKYFNTGGITQFGTTNFDGKKFAQVPEYSASAILNYDHKFDDVLSGFGNVSVVYRGKEFMDDYNLSYIPGRVQVDFRAGVNRNQTKLEVFVKNVLDDRKYTGGGVSQDFSPAGGNFAFFGAFAPPRQTGVRLLQKF